MTTKRSSALAEEHPGWLDDWVRTALELFNKILLEAFTGEQLAKNGFGAEVSADELYIHCVLLAAGEWQKLASESPDEFTQRRFLTFCRLYEDEAKFRIQRQLFRNEAN